ncbi:hypothetical protein OPT61_g4523 [Boeremia exigua]|uniref:Uncharacterized protein n=1 Tax=Boeremia exigua TaxID=749465 RepID=A0ACC2IDS6_9PLEO|nr:hypothetical protein OPT61_g4523 [Boeremia exigua]
MARKSTQATGVQLSTRSSDRLRQQGEFHSTPPSYGLTDRSQAASEDTKPATRRSGRNVSVSRPQDGLRSDAPSSGSDEDYEAAEASDRSSKMSSPAQLSRSSAVPEATQPRGKAPGGRPRVLARPRVLPLVLEQQQGQARLSQDATREEKRVKRLRTERIKRDTERQQKARELEHLSQQTRVAPAPWVLQLPALPPRQNITGRTLPLKLVANDTTLPLTNNAHDVAVAQLLDSMRDVRESQDSISLTNDFKYLWLKPSLDGQYFYNEVDLERVCRKLVSIAEGLHVHGLGATEIFCPRTIKRAQEAQAMSFQDRIDKVALLMRKSKARCNAFLLNNTLEDTIALIDLKVSDQVSNVANNRTRSLKLGHTNDLLGIYRGARRPKDENKMPIVPTRNTAAPEDGTIIKKDPADDDDAQHADSLQTQTERSDWLTAAEQQSPTDHRESGPSYDDPSLDPFSGFNFSEEIGRETELFFSGRQDTAGLNPYLEADRAFFAISANQHGIAPNLEAEDADGSQFFDLNAEEQVTAHSSKRQRLQQPEPFSVNSLLRGRTAKPSGGSQGTTRR